MGAAVRSWRARFAWDGEQLREGLVVSVDAEGTLVEAPAAHVEELDGLLLPGLVNAHTHLEFGPLDTPRGLGFLPWAKVMVEQGLSGGHRSEEHKDPSAIAARNARAARDAGTAAVLDITNTGVTPAAIAAAGMTGLVLQEFLGIDRPEHPLGALRPTPHTPHTTHPAFIQACGARPGPWSIHFDEDPEERRFLHGEGPWWPFMRAVGRDLSAFEAPMCGSAEYLERLGVLQAPLILVHATCTRGEDLDRVARAGVAVCLCVRSNLHITGLLPDVPGMLARGIPLLVGTDGLTSSPDFDLVAEGAALRAAFPEVPAATWLRAMSGAAAERLGLPLGRLRPGTRPGLTHLDVSGRYVSRESALDLLFDGTPWARRRLGPAGVET